LNVTALTRTAAPNRQAGFQLAQQAKHRLPWQGSSMPQVSLIGNGYRPPLKPRSSSGAKRLEIGPLPNDFFNGDRDTRFSVIRE
jgi:hypothetical protein